MKQIAILLAVLLSASCADDRRCAEVCTALRSVRPDKEGYLPRESVFHAVRISEADSSSFLVTMNGGHAVLDCGCWFEYQYRASPNRAARPTSKTIDEILNNPNRTAFPPPSQLDSVVLVDKQNRELCRLESSARRRWLAAEAKRDAEQFPTGNRP